MDMGDLVLTMMCCLQCIKRQGGSTFFGHHISPGFSLCFDRTPLTSLFPFNWFLNDLDKIKTKTSTTKPLEAKILLLGFQRLVIY